jgi:hypothetical protein
MKNLILSLVVLLLLCSCQKETVPESPSAPVLVGQTFSGYSFTSSLDGHKVYDGYRFVSSTRVVELLLDENTKVLSQTEVGYSGVYPNFKIEGKNTANGFWDATFLSPDVMQVRSIMMKKW